MTEILGNLLQYFMLGLLICFVIMPILVVLAFIYDCFLERHCVGCTFYEDGWGYCRISEKPTRKGCKIKERWEKD